MPPSTRFGKHQNGTIYKKQERKKESERLQPPHWVIARQHKGDYLYTVNSFVMSRQGDVWRTPLECRMEGPIRVPQIGVSHWRALYCMQRALLRAPHVEHSLENSRGPNLKGKQQKSKRKNPSLPKCRQEQNHPDFCWCYFQQCARLNMCFK